MIADVVDRPGEVVDVVAVEGRHECPVKQVDQFPGVLWTTDPDLTIRSVHVARPTLDDVFMTYTGRTIRDAEASGTERNRANPWMRSGGRR